MVWETEFPSSIPVLLRVGPFDIDEVLIKAKTEPKQWKQKTEEFPSSNKQGF